MCNFTGRAGRGDIIMLVLAGVHPGKTLLCLCCLFPDLKVAAGAQVQLMTVLREISLWSCDSCQARWPVIHLLCYRSPSRLPKSAQLRGHCHAPVRGWLLRRCKRHAAIVAGAFVTVYVPCAPQRCTLVARRGQTHNTLCHTLWH